MSTLQSWREESRQDRLTQARIDRDREAARVQARITEREAAARVRQVGADSRRAARIRARADRAARRATVAAWAAGHVTDLLFVPVIVVPAVLAWTAMAAYGASLYGPAGRALPAFSEGAMWAFAAAVTITCHRHPGRPVWHLRLGTIVFAASGAALNFAHGLTASGPVAGAVMALVSVAGVTAHQLVTAGPRRSRAEREAARTGRLIGRRERAARRGAIRRAPVALDEDGNARLVLEPGPVNLGRRRDRKAGISTANGGSAGAPEPKPARTRRSAPRVVKERTRKRAPEPVTEAAAEVHFAADLASGQAPSARRIRRELHVGQPRANELRQHLEKVLTT